MMKRLLRISLAYVDGSETADASELVTEVGVELLKRGGKFNIGHAVVSENRDAIVDVLHIRRLNEGVGQVFVLGIKYVFSVLCQGQSNWCPLRRSKGGTTTFLRRPLLL